MLLVLVSIGPSISCCIILYKLIAKVLATRLQNVMGDFVDQRQAGFIPNKQILDKILLATEIIKGYGRKNMSSRCMVMIDLKKAYDFVEWPF